MSLPLQKIEWEEILNIATTNHITVEGERPNRVIYPPSGPFDGVDPSHPNPERFSPGLWKSLQQFFITVHPVVRVGRYGFAQFLKEEGPSEVREMPLGSITELVQLALHRHILKYHKTQVSTAVPEAYGIMSGMVPYNPHMYYSPEEIAQPPPMQTALMDNYSYNDTQGLLEEEQYAEDDDRSGHVPVSFLWPYPGTSVLVTGSFFNWRNTLALYRKEREIYFDRETAGAAGNKDLFGFNGINNNSSSNNLVNLANMNLTSNNINNNNNVVSPPNVNGMVDSDDVFSTVLFITPGRYEYKVSEFS